jgi:hypothetical protein
VKLSSVEVTVAYVQEITSEDMSATRGATAAAPPNLLMLKTCLYAGKQETIISQQRTLYYC